MDIEIQAEMRDDIKNLLVQMSRVEANQENLAKQLDDLCEVVTALPEKCATGKDHEKRIKTIEDKPDKKIKVAPIVIAILSMIGTVTIGILMYLK